MSDRRTVFNSQLGLWLFWDQAFGQYYYYDSQQDQLVYNDRRRVPRPSHVPRGHYANPHTQQPQATAPLEQFSYSGSPAKGNAYTTSVNPALPPSNTSGLPNVQPQSSSSGVRVDPTSQDANRKDRYPEPVRPRVVENGGWRTVFAQDDQSQVQTVFATLPKNKISDPVLLAKGVASHRMLMGTGGAESESLFPGFTVRKPGHKFFTVGRVFLVLWVEPAGESGTSITAMEHTDPAMSIGRFNQRIFSKVRRFVVIRAGKDYCSALPIVTYGRQGVGKKSVKKSDHAIIYTSAEAPLPLSSERPGHGEGGMRTRSLRVIPDDKDRDKLDSLSRIDFAKVHTIQHNIKVKAFGMIHPHSMSDLMNQFNSVWGTQVITNENVNDWSTGTVKAEGSSSASQTASTKGKSPVQGRHPSVASASGSAAAAATSGVADASPQAKAQAQNAYARMIKQGLSPEQAVTALIANLRASSPSMTQATATAHVKHLLGQDRKTSADGRIGLPPPSVARDIPPPPKAYIPPPQSPPTSRSYGSARQMYARNQQEEDEQDDDSDDDDNDERDSDDEVAASARNSGDELYE